ncbi:MAG: SpoIVB peptidase S55 domain-containing protein, partial [Puniceicoccales bacterium]
MTRKLTFPLFLLLALTASLTSAQAEETISLDEIQPGDPGEWKTVVSGTEVESFPLTVVGIVDSFAGPGIPIILCRATDPTNTQTGPVSGMSGSPVYINGRLAGAYAYGFPWSKDKTLIGVTP